MVVFLQKQKIQGRVTFADLLCFFLGIATSFSYTTTFFEIFGQNLIKRAFLNLTETDLLNLTQVLVDDFLFSSRIMVLISSKSNPDTFGVFGMFLSNHSECK